MDRLYCFYSVTLWIGFTGYNVHLYPMDMDRLKTATKRARPGKLIDRLYWLAASSWLATKRARPG